MPKRVFPRERIFVSAQEGAGQSELRLHLPPGCSKFLAQLVLPSPWGSISAEPGERLASRIPGLSSSKTEPSFQKISFLFLSRTLMVPQRERSFSEGRRAIHLSVAAWTSPTSGLILYFKLPRKGEQPSWLPVLTHH